MTPRQALGIAKNIQAAAEPRSLQERQHELLNQAFLLYREAFNLFGAWHNANPKAPIDDPEGIRLSKQINAARAAWIACGGQEEVVIG